MCETSLTGEEETLAGTLLLSILNSGRMGVDPISEGSEVLLPSGGCREEPADRRLPNRVPSVSGCSEAAAGSWPPPTPGPPAGLQQRLPRSSLLAALPLCPPRLLSPHFLRGNQFLQLKVFCPDGKKQQLGIVRQRHMFCKCTQQILER